MPWLCLALTSTCHLLCQVAPAFEVYVAEVKGMTLSFESVGLLEALLVYAARDAARLDSVRVRGEAENYRTPELKTLTMNPKPCTVPLLCTSHP